MPVTRLFQTIVCGLLAGLTACREARTFPIEGTWRRGGISGDHFGIYVLQIRESGGQLTGTACHTDSGHFIGTLPVTGHYPYVLLELGAGSRFSGGIISPEEIHGSYEFPGGSQEWTFERVAASEFEACQTARP